MTVPALTMMKEGGTAEALLKTNKKHNTNRIELFPGPYPILSNCAAAKWQL